MKHNQKTDVALKFLDKCINEYYKSVHHKSQNKLGNLLKHHLIDALHELDADPYATPTSSTLQKK
jgi:acetyl-CoA carboxylase alpha subunit